MLIKVISTSRDHWFQFSSHLILSHICGNMSERSPHLAIENCWTPYGIFSMKTEQWVLGAIPTGIRVPGGIWAKATILEILHIFLFVKCGWHLVMKMTPSTFLCKHVWNSIFITNTVSLTCVFFKLQKIVTDPCESLREKNIPYTPSGPPCKYIQKSGKNKRPFLCNHTHCHSDVPTVCREMYQNTRWTTSGQEVSVQVLWEGAKYPLDYF